MLTLKVCYCYLRQNNVFCIQKERRVRVKHQKIIGKVGNQERTKDHTNNVRVCPKCLTSNEAILIIPAKWRLGKQNLITQPGLTSPMISSVMNEIHSFEWI